MKKEAILAAVLALSAISAPAQTGNTPAKAAPEKSTAQKKPAAPQKTSAKSSAPEKAPAKEKSEQTSAAASFAGTWYASNPFFQMELNRAGDKLTGEYSTTPFEDGRKIQTGELDGLVKGKSARVTFTSSWAKGKGEAQLSLSGKNLVWNAIKSADQGEDYAPKKSTLKRTSKEKKE